MQNDNTIPFGVEEISCMLRGMEQVKDFLWLFHLLLPPMAGDPGLALVQKSD
jgi:hypothetical protein